jgi:hypothetical protein
VNKQPLTDDKGWSSSFGIGRGANTPSLTNKLVTKNRKNLGTGRIPCINNLSEIQWIDERASSSRAVAEYISKYKLDLVGVEEVRWDGDGSEPTGEYKFKTDK